MPKFIKDFLDIYAYENEKQFLTFGSELEGRHPKIDPVTGKKKISVVKIITRVFGTAVLAYFITMLVRYILVWG